MTAAGGTRQSPGAGGAATSPAEAGETLPGALEALPVAALAGLVFLDRQGRISDINPEARQMLHCSLPDVVGRDFWEVVPDRLAERYQAAARKALAASAQYVFTAHSEFEGDWIEYAFIRHDDGYTISLRDVSAARSMAAMLKDSERRNQLIFDANPNAMWVFDAVSLKIISVNQAAVEFYGIPRKMFLKLKMGALFPDGEGAALLSSMDLRQGAADHDLTIEICKQKKVDGQLVLVELACGRIRWNEHKAILVSLADVTERHLADRDLRRENAEMEEELERLRRDVKKSGRDLEAFTYALSNDLQGPLHAANGFAAMLGDKYSALLDDAGRHYVNRIQASMRQLGRLVDDLRVLVQLPQVGELEVIDVAALCNVLVADLRRRHPQRVVTMEINAALPLVADKALLTRALASLLDNSWKFTSGKSEGWIRVALRPGKVPHETVLQVSDNGVGFDATYTEKLFTPFQRLHSSADFPGNGLGLAIVKSVADRHGGRVWAETSPTGASFCMVFPQDDVLLAA
ncbi:MAG: ATP-binding protein [Pseudomonadota bacterium]